MRGKGTEGAPRLAAKIYKWEQKLNLKLGEEI